MKNVITISDIMALRPCSEYTRARVEALWAGRESLTLLEILDLDISIPDRLWAVLHDEFIGARLCRELACDFAERVLPIYEARYPDDTRPRVVIETARAEAEAYWAAGAAAEAKALWAARAAYWAAAAAAVAAAARAEAEAGAAAEAKALWAARAAYWAAEAEAAGAAEAEARQATSEAEREWQLARVREVLEKEAKL